MSGRERDGSDGLAPSGSDDGEGRAPWIFPVPRSRRVCLAQFRREEHRLRRYCVGLCCTVLWHCSSKLCHPASSTVRAAPTLLPRGCKKERERNLRCYTLDWGCYTSTFWHQRQIEASSARGEMGEEAGVEKLCVLAHLNSW